jgi:C4-dicarboxylate transporter DctM subunit
MLGVVSGMLFGLISLSVPIAAVIGILALVQAWIYSPMPLYLAAGDIFWTNRIDFTFTVGPLFILMGEILLRADVAKKNVCGPVALALSAAWWADALKYQRLHLVCGHLWLIYCNSGNRWHSCNASD